MCDYSLHMVASRPAKAGDKLETTSFCGTTTRGFAAIGEPNVAVCLLPGTEIAFEKEAEYQPSFRVFPTVNVGERTARFRRVKEDNLNEHRDALEFSSGEIVLLTRLCEGQHATVLQLPASPRVAKEADEHKTVGQAV